MPITALARDRLSRMVVAMQQQALRPPQYYSFPAAKGTSQLATLWSSAV